MGHVWDLDWMFLLPKVTLDSKKVRHKHYQALEVIKMLLRPISIRRSLSSLDKDDESYSVCLFH
jgi:hypothetical protein